MATLATHAGIIGADRDDQSYYVAVGDSGNERAAARRLELHVRSVPGEDMVNLYLALLDKTVVTLNRSSTDDIANTLRRLALTLRKRQRTDSGASKGTNKGSKKRPKAAAGPAAAGGDGGVTASLVSASTGEVLQLDGALNGDGWFRLCGSSDDTQAASKTDIKDTKISSTEALSVPSPLGAPPLARNRARTNVLVRIGPLSLPARAVPVSTNLESETVPIAAAAAEAATATGDVAANTPSFLELDVVLNPPAVTSLECPIALPMAGFAIFARAELEFGSALEWEWLREKCDVGRGGGEGEKSTTTSMGPIESGSGKNAAGGGGGGKGQKGQATRPDGGDSFTDVVGRSCMYTPDEEDIGRRLMVRCTPVCASGRRGRPVVRILMEPVRTGPEPGLLTLRRRWLQEREASGSIDNSQRLRVVCYNILADMYCTSVQADEVLYPYCPKQYREADYRMQMVLRELRGYTADLIMLQECEAKTFQRYLKPGLEHDGFEGLYLNKAGSAQEGEALFYRTSAFTLDSSHDFVMRDAIPELSEFKELLKAFPRLAGITAKRLTTVAQVAVLRPTSPALLSSSMRSEEIEGARGASDIRLIVANTHLYFHPNAAHIRLMQMVAVAERVSKIKADLLAKGLRPAIVIGGDLNSPPWGPVRYMSGELIGPESDLWGNVATFDWGDRFFDEIEPETAENASAHDGDESLASPPVQPTRTVKEGSVPSTSSGGDMMDCQEGESGQGEGTGSLHPRPVIPVPYLRLHQLALKLASGTPAFTNFTPSFTEALDYVFIDGGVGAAGGQGEVEDQPILTLAGRDGGRKEDSHVAPTPEEKTLRALTPGLPSEIYPSDHVSLVVDLEFSGR